MVEKGKKYGELNCVLRRQDSSYNDNRVNPQIELDGVEVPSKQEMLVDLKHNSRVVETFEATRYKRDSAFTLPTEVIHEQDLRPGQSVLFELYEAVEKTTQDDELEDFADNAAIIDRVTTRSDAARRDNIDSRLASEKVVLYLEERGGEAEVTFRNVKTGKECVAETHCNYSNGGESEFQFPVSARDEIEASPGDLIEVIRTANDGREPHEKIDEMYEMISEMYNAYIEAKND